MKRVFVAVDLPSAVKQTLGNYCDKLKNSNSGSGLIRWVKPEKMHITLHFAGSLDDSALTRLIAIVDQTAQNTQIHNLILAETGAFIKRKTRSNVLWIGAKSFAPQNSREPYDLWSVLEVAAMSMQEQQDHLRRYKPHVTIARLKDPAAVSNLIEAHLSHSFEPIEFEVNEFVIYENTPLPSGSEYSVLSKHPLKGG